MNKEFIPYTQSLELKELGFNEPCLGYWNIDPYLPKPTFNLVKPFDHEWCVPAPLYQQAFSWLREKYGLIGWVEGKTFFMYCIESTIPTDGQLNLSPFKTYEEAELACIVKLIQIVKQKQL